MGVGVTNRPAGRIALGQGLGLGLGLGLLGGSTRIFTSPFGPGRVSSISKVAAAEASEGRTVLPEGEPGGSMMYALARGGGSGGDGDGGSEEGDASDDARGDEVVGLTRPVSAASSAACCRCLEKALEARIRMLLLASQSPTSLTAKRAEELARLG